MKQYIAVVRLARGNKSRIYPVGEYQDAAAALVDFALVRRRDILTSNTHTIVICPAEDEKKHVATLTKETGS